MSSKKPTTPPPSNRRAQLQAEREQAEREAKARRRNTYIIVAVLVLAMIGLVSWAIVNKSRDKGTGGGAVGETSVVIGQASAAVTVSVFQDYMCPYCGEFERTNRSDLEDLVSEGSARIEFHPMSFLDRYSNGTQYSSRAANAFVTVANADPGHAMAFNAGLFDQQPEENSDGLSDDQIARIALDAGVPQSVVDTFSKNLYADFVTKATQAAFDDGVTGTPTVRINGAAFTNIYTAGPLAAAVRSAAASGTPTSSPSASR